MKTTKKIFIIFSLFLTALGCFAEETNSSPDFETYKKQMIMFHEQKVIDHQNVSKCIEEAKNQDEMNLCNKPLEKYRVDKEE